MATTLRPPQPANETEARLLDCALTIFAAKGYDATSVREIIEAAGVTRPVLYYYFDSKEELFKRLIRVKYHESCCRLDASLASESGCEAKLKALITAAFAEAAEDPRVPRLMFQTYYGPPVPCAEKLLQDLTTVRFLIVCKVIEEGLTAGEIHGGDAAAMALAFCCLMDQHINVLARLAECKQRLTPELARSLVDLFLQGAGTSVAGGPVKLPPFAADPKS